MKGFLASVLALVPELVAAPLKRLVHKPDEFVARDQLDACDAFLHKVKACCES